MLAKNIPVGTDMDAEPVKARLAQPSNGLTSMTSSGASVLLHSLNKDDGTALRLCGARVWA